MPLSSVRNQNSDRILHYKSYASTGNNKLGLDFVDDNSSEDEFDSFRSPPIATEESAAANAMRAAILKTQLQAHAPAAIQISNSVRDKHGIDEHLHMIETTREERSTLAAQVAKKRRNSLTHGLIPQAMEEGTTRTYFSSPKAAVSALNLNYGELLDPAKSNSVLPVSSPNSSQTAEATAPSGAADAKPSSYEPAENGGPDTPVFTRRQTSMPTPRQRKTAVQMLKQEVENYKKTKKSACLIPIMHPAAPSRMKWDLLLAAVLVWNLVEIPFQVCFSVEAECKSGYDVLGTLLDLFFICDVIVNFHTGFIDDGKYIESPRVVAAHYIRKGGFPLDLVTTIPYGRLLNIYAGSWCTPEMDENESANTKLAVLPRLLRIFRIFKLVKLFRLVKLMNVISQWEGEAGVGFSRFLRMLTLFFYVIFLSHIAGCLFAYIALSSKEDNDNEWHEDSWVWRYASNNGDIDVLNDKFRLYVLSFYWAITTLTTVGYGDLLPFTTGEIILTVVVQFVGTMVFAYIMASITSVVSSEDMTAMLIKQKISELNEYMSHRNLPPELMTRIRSHYEYQWKRTTIYDEEQILESLPPFLRMDVACSMNLDLVKNVPVLAALGDDCMAMLVTKLKPMQLVPGEQVVKKGSVGHEMYFITEGTVDVYMGDDPNDPDEVPKCSLEQGSYFGEPAILSQKPVKRGATLQARTFCSLESLSKIDFLAVAEFFPDILKMLSEVQALTGEQELNRLEAEGHTTCRNTKLILKSLKVVMARLDHLDQFMASVHGDEDGSPRDGLGQISETHHDDDEHHNDEAIAERERKTLLQRHSTPSPGPRSTLRQKSDNLLKELDEADDKTLNLEDTIE